MSRMPMQAFLPLLAAATLRAERKDVIPEMATPTVPTQNNHMRNGKTYTKNRKKGRHTKRQRKLQKEGRRNARKGR